MARSHARIFTSIWDDPDFLARSSQAQRCYMMLLSQPNLGHAGILPTTVRRWTLLSADEDEAALRTALAELAEHNFVVVDERTEELVIRSLIRNDGVWKQPKVLAVAITEAASIRSPRLRACITEELAKLDEVSSLPDSTRPGVESLLSDLPHRLAYAHLELDGKGGAHPPADPPPDPPAELGDEGGSDVLRARVHAAPTPATDPIPGPVPPPAGAAKPRREPKQAAGEEFNAGLVVAAFVEGATTTGQKRPATSICARVGKQARELHHDGYTMDALTSAARTMGAGEWNDLAIQVRKDDAAANGQSSQRRSGHQTYRNPKDQSLYETEELRPQ